MGATENGAKPVINIKKIPDSCNFWMIRTNRGVLYNEFVERGFVALGWNSIVKKTLEMDTKEQLKENISSNYPEEAIPMGAVNKCTKFIEKLASGDMAVIVGAKVVAFAEIGEYYEENNEEYTPQKEREMWAGIRAGTYQTLNLPCPYIKRRKIKVIAQMPEEKLDPHLFKALSSRHSLSDLGEYSSFILSACYDIFTYQNQSSFVFRVTSSKKLKSRDVAGIMCCATDIFEDLMPPGVISGDVAVRSTLASPGEIVLIISNVMQHVSENWEAYLLLYIIVCGGEINFGKGSITMPSLAALVKWLYGRKDAKKERDREDRRAEAELTILECQAKSSQIQLNQEKKIIEAAEKLKEHAIALDVQPLDRSLIDASEMFRDMKSYTHDNI